MEVMDLLQVSGELWQSQEQHTAVEFQPHVLCAGLNTFSEGLANTASAASPRECNFY